MKNQQVPLNHKKFAGPTEPVWFQDLALIAQTRLQVFFFNEIIRQKVGMVDYGQGYS